MSRKSRQHAAAKKLKHVAPPKIALFITLVGLALGTLFAIPTRIVTKDEAVRVTAALTEVQGNYRSARRKSLRQVLHTITVCFADHDPLEIGRVIADEELLAELSALPAGTALDMLVQPDSTAILALHAGDQELIRFEDTISLLERGNTARRFFCIPLFALSGYGVWSLVMCWQYRRVLDSHL